MSENIKEALEYAVELAGNEDKIITDSYGTQWYDRNKHHLTQLEENKYYPRELVLSTLSSLIRYYQNNLNQINEYPTIIVVETPQKVVVYSSDDERKKRSELIVVRADVPEFDFGSFYNSEKFNIALQSKFVDANDRSVILDYISKLSIENSSDLEDDGISQVTTVRNGIASKGKGKAPNPVLLTPYRTFIEVEQPSSSFVFRINRSAELALFEADGGKWIHEAKRNIAEYLSKELNYSDSRMTILF